MKLTDAIHTLSNSNQLQADAKIEAFYENTISAESIDIGKLLSSRDNLSNKDREALLIKLSLLEGDERDNFTMDERFKDLLGKFKTTIVRHCERKNFGIAVSMTELSLMISPNDFELRMLQKYLEARS